MRPVMCFAINAAAVLLLNATPALATPPVERLTGAATTEIDPAYNWSGFYVGANAGFGWGTVRTLGNETRAQNVTVVRFPGAVLVSSADSTTSNGPALTQGKATGFIGGAQAGYNWQAGRWLVGIEADAQGSDQRAESLLCTVPGCPVGTTAIPVKYGLDWYGTLRGRVGLLATNRLLLYATGGLAYGHFAAEASLLNLGWDSTRLGWTVGGGAEVAIDSQWSVRLEYLHTDLGSVGSGSTSSTSVSTSTGLAVSALTGLAAPPFGLAPPPIFNTITTTNINSAFNSRFSDSVIRVGVNYHFVAGGTARPIVVKY